MKAIAIEHLEEHYSPWLLYEYIHAAQISSCRVIYTNIRNGRVARILSRYGEVYSQHAWEILPRDSLIVLDPKAEEALTPMEARRYSLVVGGILGDYPPRGRTRELLTEPLGLPARSIGEGQYSIDGAVYVACQIQMGRELDKIMYVDGLTVKGDDHEVHLPYRYPIIGGEPLISPVIRRILEVEGVFSEYWLRDFGREK